MKRYRKISMGGARNPGDGSPARRLRGGARWGPSGPPGGGIDIDYCAFPTCPGNPRGIVSAPALRFCTLLPPPPSPTLSASHRQRRTSLLLSACLSRFPFSYLSFSFSSLFFSLSASTSSLPFSLSFFTYRGRNQGIGASAGFPLENQFVALSLCVGVTDRHGDRAHSYCL